MAKKTVTNNKGEIDYIDVDYCVTILPDYEQTVEQFIREKYSLNDELAICNNRMAVFDANLLPKEKEEEYNQEYYAYQIFREECKKKAREICGITK